MFEGIIEFFLSKPSRLVTLGKGLMGIGAAMLITGMIGRVMKVPLSIYAKTGTASPQLSDVFPGFITWLIPESLLGWTLMVLFAGVGFQCWRVGMRYQRRMFR